MSRIIFSVYEIIYNLYYYSTKNMCIPITLLQLKIMGIYALRITITLLKTLSKISKCIKLIIHDNFII